MKKLIFWWLFGLATASAQQLPLKQYTVSDGLAQSQVGSLHQDHNGYLWIATRAGLSRFDGNSFVNHTVATGLPGHWVLEISESGNDIWGRTPSHFFRVLGDSIAAFSEQPDSLLYPGTLLATGSGEDAVVILSQKDNRLHLTRIAHEKSGKMRSSHTEQRKVKALARMRWDARSNGFLIQDSSGGLFFLNEKEILPVQHPNPLLICGQDFENPSRVLVHDILTGSLFKHESGDLIELNVKVDPRTLCNPEYIGTYAGRKGEFFVVSRKYLQVIHPLRQARTFTLPFIPNSFLVDRENNLWMGTETGLVRVQSLFFIIPELKGVKEVNFWASCSGKDSKVWMACLNGELQEWESRSLTMTRTWYPFSGSEFFFYPHCICDAKGIIWFNTNPKGLLRFDGRFFRPEMPAGFSSADGFYVFDDNKKNRILHCFNQGLHIRSLEGESKIIPLKEISPKGFAIVSITKDTTGRYWLGGFRGLRWWDGENTFSEPDPGLFEKEFSANALLTDARGNVWIGNARGLYVYDYKSLTRIQFPELTNIVTSLSVTGDSLLLAGTIEGIGILDLKHYYSDRGTRIRFFNRKNGFLVSEVNQNATSSDDEGKVWIGANDGLVVFDPRWYLPDTTPPELHLVEWEWLDESMNWLPLTMKSEGKLRLDYFKHNLRFRFSGINFSCPERVSFRYILEGYDNSWSDVVKDNQAVYTNLSPGKYTFRVKASNEFGNWTMEECALSFEIVPAFWQRTGFKILTALLIAAVIAAISVTIINRRKQKRDSLLRDELKKLDLQIKTIRSQMEPHFTFNAINGIGSAILSNDKDTALRYLQKLASLIRASLVDTNHITRSLEREIEFVTHYLEIERFRFSNQFEYEINTDQDVVMHWHVPKMILQVYVENAVKHGILASTKQGKVMVDIRLLAENQLLIVIEDNGIGRAASARKFSKSTGMGMQIMEQYFDLIQKMTGITILYTIEDLSGSLGEASGTRVSLGIPVRLCILLQKLSAEGTL